MKLWLRNLRRRWAPSPEERYEDGENFAVKHFASCSTEDEADMLFDALPLEPNDPFDAAIASHYRKLCRTFWTNDVEHS